MGWVQCNKIVEKGHIYITLKYVFYVYLFVYGLIGDGYGYAHATVHMWRSKDNLQESVPFFLPLGFQGLDPGL